jgi:hypothetical protein
MESEHDDQLRAWMKQVRDVSYIAKDCVQTYVSDIDPLQAPICSCAFLRNLPRIIWTCRKRHRLGKKIQDLKVRVLEVGERHKRYDVTFRSTQARKRSVANKKGADEEARRKDFLDALLGPQRHEDDDGSHAITVGNVGKAIRHLPSQLQSRAAAAMIRAIVEKCSSSKASEMLLRALYVFPLESNHMPTSSDFWEDN